jgi:hypothetical protein
MILQPSNGTTAITRYYSHQMISQPSNDTTAIKRYYSVQMILQPSNDTTAIKRYYSVQMILTTAIKSSMRLKGRAARMEEIRNATNP